MAAKKGGDLLLLQEKLGESFFYLSHGFPRMTSTKIEYWPLVLFQQQQGKAFSHEEMPNEDEDEDSGDGGVWKIFPNKSMAESV